MKPAQESACPVCQSTNQETFFQMDCGNLDGSALYPTINLGYCRHCGHIFNQLTAEELTGLARYYNDEYAPANLEIADKTADRPGSAGLLTTRRYEQLYQSLLPHVSDGCSVLDVGCALGGFLDFLQGKGFSKLTGVDSTKTYVDQGRRGKNYTIEIGSAESLPFTSATFDVVVIEQVLEHLSNPLQAFLEAGRVLKNGGILCIGVPDAARYADYYFFDFYWLLLREHIQHFDISHLALLGRQAGFELCKHHETVHAIMTEQMLMPNLYAVFQRTDRAVCGDQPARNDFTLKKKIDAYLVREQERQSRKRREMETLIRSKCPVYAWGIGREFLYLYESASMKHCNIAGLIDANAFKEQSCTVSGMKINKGENLLPDAPSDTVLLITACAHTAAIRKAACAMGYQGRFFDLNANGGLPR